METLYDLFIAYCKAKHDLNVYREFGIKDLDGCVVIENSEIGTMTFASVDEAIDWLEEKGFPK